MKKTKGKAKVKAGKSRGTWGLVALRRLGRLALGRPAPVRRRE